MKIYRKTLALAAVMAAVSLPALAQSASADSAAASEAAQMVGAIAELPHPLDTDKTSPETTFQAELNQKITLSNGTVLPAHTVLIGKVTRDDKQAAGTSEFALRFEQAKLKDGKSLPIKATIIDIERPTFDPQYAASNDWTSRTLTVQQLNVVSGVDMHSQIASNDSAVFVSTKKHELKVPAGSRLKLAIAPATDAPTSTN